VPDESINYPEVGVRMNQGSAQTSAGNKFSPSPPLPESHFSNPEQPEVTYYFREGVTDDEPVNISEGVDPQQAFDPKPM
ncbi:MAG: hypothetical protein IPJ00_11815, partial [Saprospirales bacterium]|nr:hypothetical protein [Saprospirales bacterium]